jgi:hypothetical protein
MDCGIVYPWSRVIELGRGQREEKVGCKSATPGLWRSVFAGEEKGKGITMRRKPKIWAPHERRPRILVWKTREIRAACKVVPQTYGKSVCTGLDRTASGGDTRAVNMRGSKEYQSEKLNSADRTLRSNYALLLQLSPLL